MKKVWIVSHHSLIATLLCSILLSSCMVQTQKRKLIPPEQIQSLDGKLPFLKVHMLNGKVYILSNWNENSEEKTISGWGELQGINREVDEKGAFTIPLDSVAIFETNVVQTSPAVAALAILTGASVVLTFYCYANPKACFGSCPTFYVSDGKKPLLQAEGFSSSIAPALEAKDIDALYRAKPLSRDFEVQLKNEALETQVIRYVHLLAIPRIENNRVFATFKGEFWQANEIIEPSVCLAPEGDCLPTVRAIDGFERISKADSNDLSAHEMIELHFSEVPPGEVGLVIASRQSLLTTFLFYQTLAYMGHSVGLWFGALERGNEEVLKSATNIGRLLGGIEVSAQDRTGEWVSVGEIHETGPLATDVHLIPLPSMSPGSTKIRLRLTRGHWRLDSVALAKLGKKVEPLRLCPTIVYNGSIRDDDAMMKLIDPDSYLTTMPGDDYTLVYSLPEDFEHYELFLESRGYYLEWMREEWLVEENPFKAAMIFFDPERALRMLAPEFKKVEEEMEDLFWNSRYVSH